VVTTKFGKTDKLLESMEANLGIDQVCWAADKEDGDRRQVNVEGHREALEQKLRDRIEDMDNADQSGPSQWLDFSQSTGHSTINSDATARIAYSHLEWALQNIALVNQNSDLKYHLVNEQRKLAAVLAQVQLLQEQLTASQQQSGTTAPVNPNDMALDIRRGGGNLEEYKSGGD
jgi:hypothetical protein